MPGQGVHIHMETQEFIDKFEEKAEKITNRINYKGTYWVIKDKDYQRLKREALAVFFDDDNELNYGMEDD